jgi:hypothetical protein
MTLSAGLGRTRLGAFWQAGAGNKKQEFFPNPGPMRTIMAPSRQPVEQVTARGAEGKRESGHPGPESGTEHGGADQIVGQQAGEPFFFCHLRRFAFELLHVHLGFDVAQIQFDMPAHGVEPGEFQRRIEFALRESCEQKEALGAKAVALEFNHEQAAGDGIGAESGLELVVAGVSPGDDVLAQGERTLEELAGALRATF